MRRRHTGHLVLVLVLSLCSQLVFYLSVVSQNWMLAKQPQTCCESVSLVSFGLFRVSVVQATRNSTDERSNLALACLFGLNVCAWTSPHQVVLKIEEIATLNDSGRLPLPCNISSRQESSILGGGCGANQSSLHVIETFMDRVAWLITVAAVVLNAIVGLVGLCLTVYNINHFPSNYFISIRGLNFWFTVSSLLAVITLLVWGFEFVIKCSKTPDTSKGLVNTSERAYLGYSYWCQLGVVILPLGCAVLLRRREKLFHCRPIISSSMYSQWNTLSISNIQ